MKRILSGLISGMLFGSVCVAQAVADPAAKAPTLEEVLLRAGRYVTGYYTDLTNVLAEEKYVQTSTPSKGPVEKRTLWSDVLLVRAEGESHYKLFRDVYKVDGRVVRDRKDRMFKLFVESPATLEKIAAEGTRYNIGGLERNFNLPTTTMCFLEPGNQYRVRFHKAGETTIQGTIVWEIRFIEESNPTIFQYNSGNLIALGTYWIEPDSGRVLKSDLTLERVTGPGMRRVYWAGRFHPENVTLNGRKQRRLQWMPGGKIEKLSGYGVRLNMVETYNFNSSVGLMVPVEMTERYDYMSTLSADGQLKYSSAIECTATLSNFRKARVASSISFPEVSTSISFPEDKSPNPPLPKNKKK